MRQSATDFVTVTVSDQNVSDLLGALAELSIAVNETKVVEQCEDRVARLKRAKDLVDSWSKVMRLRADLKRAEAEVKREQ